MYTVWGLSHKALKKENPHVQLLTLFFLNFDISYCINVNTVMNLFYNHETYFLKQTTLINRLH